MPERGENIYKRRDGRYEGRYVIGKTATGKTKNVTTYWLLLCASKEETFAKKGHAASDSCINSTANRITVQEWMMHWLENELLGSVKPSSYHTYMQQIQHHVLPSLETYLLSELTPSYIHAFIPKCKEWDMLQVPFTALTGCWLPPSALPWRRA